LCQSSAGLDCGGLFFASRAPPVKKIILISILLATIAIPTRAANERNALLGLRKALLHSVVFNVVYWLLLLLVYLRID